MNENEIEKAEWEKFIRDIKSVAGVFGIAIIDKAGIPIALDGVAESESAQIANINAALDEASKALNIGEQLQTLIIAENYKILIHEVKSKVIIIFMDTATSMQMVKSKFKVLH
jgi:predicted regulator of Ras-like GTPase activity (Roadblock/LC7/MglB family)